MMLVAISIVVWGVALFSLRMAFVGNPLYKMVFTAPKAVLQEAAECLNPVEPKQTEDDDANDLIVRFSRFVFLAAILFTAEIGICFYFINLDPTDTISWFLLGKNVIVFGVGYWLHQQVDQNPIQAILRLPNWAPRWERISYLLSGICMIIQLIRINSFV